MTDFWEEVVSDYMDINFSTTEQSIWLCMSGKLGKMGERYAESFLEKTGNLPCEKHLICPPKKTGHSNICSHGIQQQLRLE